MTDKQLLQKYFAGQCDARELKTVLSWLNDDNADHTLLLELMQAGWENGKEQVHDPVRQARLLGELRTRLYPVRRPVRQIWYSVAASAAILIMAAAFLFRDGVRPRQRQAETARHWKVLSNTGSHMQKATLPDSTTVWLTAGSNLFYDHHESNPQRSVRLEGQAFFDVAHNTERPFVVQTGSLAVTVLGTTFNIEAYPAEENIRVSLVSGKVSVQPSGKKTELLRGGEMLTYTKAGGACKKETLVLNDMQTWTNGQIVFHDISVGDALERLAKYYQLHITYGKGVHLGDQRFSTIFRHETPELMIRNILFITGYTYRLQGKELEIINAR